jgi:hypothetical protein
MQPRLNLLKRNLNMLLKRLAERKAKGNYKAQCLIT